MLQKCHGHEPTQAILDETAGGIFFYKSPNQDFQFLDDKVLFKLDWSTKSKDEHHQESVAFANGSNNDNSRLMDKLEALTIKMDYQFQSLKEELQDMHNKYYDLKDYHAFKNNTNKHIKITCPLNPKYVAKLARLAAAAEQGAIPAAATEQPGRPVAATEQATNTS
ncbi:hypothetical protein Tco_0448436 [Tanacetum coccineum]